MGELISKLGIDGKLLIANTITFFLVLVILRKYAYGPIMKALDDRRQTISDGLDRAKKGRDEYAALQEQKTIVLKEAKQEAQALVRQAETEALTLRQTELEKTKAEAAQVLAKTREQLQRERQQMVQAAKADLAGLVTTATEQVLGETVDADLEKKLQAQAVKAVKHV